MFRLHPDGSVEASTAVEAIELLRLLQNRSAPEVATMATSAPIRSAPPPAPASPAGGWTDFFQGLAPEQRQVLVLIRARGSIRLDELRSELNAPNNNSVSGHFTAIYRAAERSGLDPRGLYVRSVEGRGRSQIVRYAPGPGMPQEVG